MTRLIQTLIACGFYAAVAITFAIILDKTNIADRILGLKKEEQQDNDGWDF